MENPSANWRWINGDVLFAVHERLLAEHGGQPGILNLDAVEAALARPLNKAHYGDPDAADLAAACAYGFARNHGFADGNKRTGWALARLFLRMNGCQLQFDKAEAVAVMNAVADGSMTENGLALWFREHL